MPVTTFLAVLAVVITAAGLTIALLAGSGHVGLLSLLAMAAAVTVWFASAWT